MTAGRTLFWAAMAVAGVMLIAPGLTPVEPSAEVIVPLEPEAALSIPQADASVSNGYASRELVRSPDGHFYAEAQVNGARITFMIDTGATLVALTRSDAQRAGIALGAERATAMGVSGQVEVIPVTIDRIAIGPLAATQVPGAVAEDLPVSLLGQSFLAQVGSVEIRGDRMVLR